MRVRVFQEADKKRRDELGDEALRAEVKASPSMPNKVSKEIEKQILNFAKKASYLITGKNKR